MQQETSSPRLLNDDLAPSTKRTWGAYSITSVWFGVVHNIGNYTLAAGMLLIGLPAWPTATIFPSPARWRSDGPRSSASSCSKPTSSLVLMAP